MADDIGGLQVSFTAEASQLRSELQRMEQQLRQFERAHGRQRVQLHAGFDKPGQRPLDDFRRDVQKRVGAVSVPIRLEVPAQQALDRQLAGLAKKIGTVPVDVKGVWAGWQTPPPGELTVNVKGIGGGTGGAAPAAAAVPPASGAERVQAPAAAIVPAGVKTAAERSAEREATRRAREEARRREREGAAAARRGGRERATNVPAPEAALINKLSGNQARAESQTQQVPKKTVFADWSNKDILETLGEPNPEKFAADLRNEAMRRGILPTPQTGGAAGFTAGRTAAAPVGGTTAARGRGLAAPETHAGIARQVRPARGQKVSELILQSAMQTGKPPPESVSMSRLRSIIPQLSAGNRERGEAWYPEANRELKRMRAAYGLEGRINDAQLSAMAGIFSGNAAWPDNLQLLSGVFQRMAQGVSPQDPEKFLGVGTFPDPIVKAVQVAQMDNPTLAQIAGRRDVQTGDQFLRRQPGKGGFFGLKTGAFTGALHAGGGPDAEAEARSVFRALTPMDRWMSRGIHGIENVGTRAHELGWKAMSSLQKKAGFKTDFGFQAGLWDFFGPAQAAAAPFGTEGTIPPLPSAANTPPTRLTTLIGQLERARAKAPRADRTRELEQAVADEQRFLQAQASPADAPRVAAFMSPTPRTLMVSPGEHIDPVSGTPTMAAHRTYGEMHERERTPSERYLLSRRQEWNREQARQARMFAGWGAPAAASRMGAAAFADQSDMSRRMQTHNTGGTYRAPGTAPYDPSTLGSARLHGGGTERFGYEPLPVATTAPRRTSRTRLTAAATGAMERASGPQRSLAEEMLGRPEDVPAAARAAMEAPAPGEAADADLLLRRYGIGAARSPEEATIRDITEQGRLMVAQARGAGQVRAVGTTLASSIATVAGGRAETQIAQRRIEQLLTLANRVGTEYGDAFANASKAQTEFDEAVARGESPERLAELSTNLEKMNQAAAPGRRQLAAVGQELEGLGGRMGKFRQAAIGFGSSIAGTIAGLAIFSVVQEGIDTFISSVERAAQPLFGFRGLAQETASSLGDLTRQTHGHADIAVAAASAQAGLGKTVHESLGPILEQRAAIDAGNKAFDEQLNLIRSANQFQFGAPGGIPGITAATGGFAGTPLGATPPFLERLLQTGSPQGGMGEQALRMFGDLPKLFLPEQLGGLSLGQFIGQNNGSPQGLQQRLTADFVSAEDAAAWNSFGDSLTSLNDAVRRANPSVADLGEAASRMGDDSAEAQRAVDATAAALKDMGATDQQVNEARANRFVVTDRGGQALAPEQLRNWLMEAQRGFGLPTPELAAAQTAMPLAANLQLQQWQGTMQRETMLPGQQYLSGLAAGALEVGGARRGFGIREMPQDIAQQAPNYDRVTGQLTQLQQAQQSVAQTGRSQLITMLREADNIMGSAAGSTSGLTRQFTTLEASIGANASAMRGLQLENMWAQVNLQVAQYDEQIRVASRSLADAQSFISGAGSGTLGVLQHQARMYERQSAEIGFQQQSLSIQSQQLGLQNAHLGIRSREIGFQTTQLQMQSRELGMQATQLSLMQRQRQINFQQAMAGFTAPGTTPEERAARIEEARAEAQFAQRQQDIAVEQFDIEKRIFALELQQLPIAQAQLEIDKQQIVLQAANIGLAQQALAVSRAAFDVQQAMIDVQAARAVEDLSHQLDLLTRARSVTLQVAINNEAIAAFQSAIERDMASLQSVIQTAYGIQQQVMSNAASLAATYGGTLASWNNIIIGRLNEYLQRARIALSGNYATPYSGSNTSSFGSGAGGGTGTTAPRAAGWLQTVSGATNITVGEAGPETVAILRNPRNLTLSGDGGAGGGVTVVVDVHDNTIGGGVNDVDGFAAIIARKVEETLGRKVSQLGLGVRR